MDLVIDSLVCLTMDVITARMRRNRGELCVYYMFIKFYIPYIPQHQVRPEHYGSWVNMCASQRSTAFQVWGLCIGSHLTHLHFVA